VAEFSFQLAERTGARVFGGPKYTVSPIYEAMFKEELDAAAVRHPEVTYEPLLIDATLALLMRIGGEALVIPTLNRDGDLLSDMILQMFGSIAGAESLVLAFDDATHIKVVMAEAPHGTAPALEGKNIANPMAMILAGAALLTYIEIPQGDRASRAIYESAFEAVNAGNATTDLGGSMSTTEFTDEVIQRVGSKLEVWSGLRS
jgi:isocitrate/isopropylmalate dehydrogenase